MKTMKKMLAISIVLAMLISNCFALLNNFVFAEGEKTIYFCTEDYDTTSKTVIFHFGSGEGAVEIPIKIEGTTANLEQDNGGCKLAYTESLGDVVRLQVLSGFNSESMSIRVNGENNFSQKLQLDQDGYVILSAPNDEWHLPGNFSFEIIHKGQNGGQGGEQGTPFAVHFDTKSYTETTAIFNVEGTNVTLTVSGTESTIHEDGDNCGIGFTEAIGNQVTMQVSDNFNSETMEIYATSDDGFNHTLPIDQNRYIIFSGTDTEPDTGNTHDWGVPNDFHLGIGLKGSNTGPQPGNNGTTIQFDDAEFVASNKISFLNDTENPVTVTITGTQSSIIAEGNSLRIDFSESLGDPVRFQVDENYDPNTMEIFAADGGNNGFTEYLSISDDKYILFPNEVLGRGGFHFGISFLGGAPMNIDQMRGIMFEIPNENDDDDIIIYANKQTTNAQGITYDKDTNTLTIENINAADKLLRLHCIGDDFKLNVVGNNKIGAIEAFTQFDDWAQELYIKGNGTLTLNETGKADNAISMCTYLGKSSLRIGANVTLNLKAKDDVIRIEMVPEEANNGPRVIFEGNQNVNVSKEQCIFHVIKRLNGMAYYKYSDDDECVGNKFLRNSDPDGLYIGKHIFDVDNNYDPIPETERYQISKYIHCVGATYDCYFIDPEFEPEHHNEIVLTPEQLAESEYSEIKETNEYSIEIPISIYNSVWTNCISDPEIYKDANNKEYAIIHNYSQDTEDVYDFESIQGTPYYWLEKNNNVDYNSLEAINIDEPQEGVYNYIVHEKTLNIIPTESHIHTPKAAVKENEVKPTCSKEGSYDEVVYCSECNAVISRTKKTVAKLAHTSKEVVSTNVIKATLSKDGQIRKSYVLKCSVCGEELGGRGDTTVIPYPKTISLSKTSFTYNNKVQKPTVKIVGSDGKAIAASNYTITYSNNNSKKVGRYTVKIVFKGNYEGTKTLTYDIVPKGVSLNKLTAGKKQFKATWGKNTTETTGYEVQYSTNNKFKSGNKTLNVKKNKTTSSTVKKLAGKKKYFVRIRTYKTVKFNGKNIKIYSGWSKVKNVTTKK